MKVTELSNEVDGEGQREARNETGTEPLSVADISQFQFRTKKAPIHGHNCSW